jgi:16S rRNA (guanine527-N7)-methyltransferase
VEQFLKGFIMYKWQSEIFKNHGLVLTPELYDKFGVYCDFLIEYNKIHNLTSITSPEDVFIKHFLDSILILKFAKIPENPMLIDIGSGAGFPGVPLKLYRPDIKLTLLESRAKKVRFLQELCEKLEIQAEVFHNRAETLQKSPEYRGKFDAVTARAVGSMNVLAQYCVPFLKLNGRFLALKGPNEDVHTADKILSSIGAEISEEIEYLLNGTDKRRLIVVKKISQSPLKYSNKYSRNKKKQS